MDITIYTTPGCFYCTQIKELMRRADLEATIINVSTSEEKEEFKKDNPKAQGFPHVIIDGETVGGLVETARLLVQKGLVSSGKKR